MCSACHNRKQMPGPSRPSQSDGPNQRRAGAQRQRRTRRQPATRHARRISWSRRIGVAAALVLLVGGAVAFASQGLRGQDPGAANVGAPPPPPLTLLPAADSITRSDKVDLTAVTPTNLRHDQQYEVRVFVNDKPVGRMDLPDDDQFPISNVPLDEGANTIRVTLVGDGGESAPSTAVAVTRDDEAPKIKIIQPTARVYTDGATLLGTTEPGADIEITDGSGRAVESSVDGNG